MFKSLTVSALAATAYGHFMVPYSSLTKNFLSQQWPNLNEYSNFKVESQFFVENEFKKLIPFNGMKCVQMVDSDGNRERMDLKLDMPGAAFSDMVEYLDFDNQVMTVYIPALKSCQKFRIPVAVNIKDFMEKASDPNAGVMIYQGVSTLEFAEGEQFYTYRLVNEDAKGLPGADQTVYFSTQTGQMEYAVTNDDSHIIIYSEQGPQEASFTDADFLEPAACVGVPVNPNFPTFDSYMQ